jgi:hypothetical protein
VRLLENFWEKAKQNLQKRMVGRQGIVGNRVCKSDLMLLLRVRRSRGGRGCDRLQPGRGRGPRVSVLVLLLLALLSVNAGKWVRGWG